MTAKLIRNKVPQAIRDRGEDPFTWTADDDEYKALLMSKLMEEATELCDSHEVEELADVLEVVWTIASDVFGISKDELEHIRHNKAIEWGDYSNRHVLYIGLVHSDMVHLDEMCIMCNHVVWQHKGMEEKDTDSRLVELYSGDYYAQIYTWTDSHCTKCQCNAFTIDI